MTAWSLEPMDITKHWVSSFAMLCQAFTAAVFCCWLFEGLSALRFVLSKWNAYSIGLRSGDWLDHCRIFYFFALKTSWVAFAVCFGSLSICTVKRRPINFAAFGWIWAESIHFRIHPAASFFCYIINKHKWPSAIESHACPCHHTASTMFYRRCGVLWIRSCSNSSPHHSGTGWS